MRNLFYLLATVFTVFAANASAKTYTYTYLGPVMDETRAWGVDPTSDFLGYRYSATLVLDEDLLGQSLLNAKFHLDIHPSESVPIPGIVAFQWWLSDTSVVSTEPTGIGRPASAGRFDIETDSFGNIVYGCFDFADGPPDGAFGCGRDFFYDANVTNYFASKGSSNWKTVSPVPLPATAFFLLTGLGAFALGRRRKSSTA